MTLCDLEHYRQRRRRENERAWADMSEIFAGIERRREFERDPASYRGRGCACDPTLNCVHEPETDRGLPNPIYDPEA